MCDDDKGRMGLYNGEKFVFEESYWSIITSLKMLWRYGFDVFRFKSYINTMLKDFDK